MPNQTVARSVITNYSLPEPRMAVPIPISVAYDTDVERVERVVLEEAQRAVSEVAGLLSDPKPVVRLIPGFGDSALELTLVCHVGSFGEQFEAQHQLRKRVLARLRAEKVEIPYPSRTVYVRSPEGVAPREPREG